MGLFCFTKKSTKTRDETVKPIVQDALVSISDDAKFSKWIAKMHRMQELAVVCWSAELSSSHLKTRHRCNELALSRIGEAGFALCSADSMPGKARQYAVYNLPCFQVFDQGCLVATFEGLASIQELDNFIAYQNDDNMYPGKGSGMSETQGIDIVQSRGSLEDTITTAWRLRRERAAQSAPTNSRDPAAFPLSFSDTGSPASLTDSRIGSLGSFQSDDTANVAEVMRIAQEVRIARASTEFRNPSMSSSAPSPRSYETRLGGPDQTSFSFTRGRRRPRMAPEVQT